MGATATFQRVIDAADDPLALASDFHNGPLSVVLPFGIWGVVAWLWFWWAGFLVVWRNYHYGDPALRHINLYLFAAFVTRCVMFLFVFGDLVADTANFAGIIGLSIAFNHGVANRQPVMETKPAGDGAQPAYLPRPAFTR
jgi:hypothetical protein